MVRVAGVCRRRSNMPAISLSAATWAFTCVTLHFSILSRRVAALPQSRASFFDALDSSTMPTAEAGTYGDEASAGNNEVPMDADYIIIGGGTAGCVLATRLCENLPDASIVVLERGAPRNARQDLQVLPCKANACAEHFRILNQLAPEIDFFFCTGHPFPRPMHSHTQYMQNLMQRHRSVACRNTALSLRIQQFAGLSIIPLYLPIILAQPDNRASLLAWSCKWVHAVYGCCKNPQVFFTQVRFGFCVVGAGLGFSPVCEAQQRCLPPYLSVQTNHCVI